MILPKAVHQAPLAVMLYGMGLLIHNRRPGSSERVLRVHTAGRTMLIWFHRGPKGTVQQKCPRDSVRASLSENGCLPSTVSSENLLPLTELFV